MTISSERLRPICRECGIKPSKKGPKSVHGYQTWTKLCGSCDSKKYRKQRVVNMTCDVCGFVAVDSCQMDIVDNKSLCACCNRLKIKDDKRQEYELTVDATISI